MGREFQAAIPGQRGHEALGQPPHVLGERLDDGARRASGHPNETDVARTPLDQRRHVGLPRASDQVALPMARHRAVLDGGGALPNRDGPDDVAARLRRRGARTSHRASLAQLRLQRLLEHAAALHEQAHVDRFMRHVHGRIIRIRLTEPASDLLGRPLSRELDGHRVTQRGVPRQATPLGPPAARPRRRVGRGRPIPPPPSVSAYLPTHRRRGPAQLAADLSHRHPAGQAAGDGLPLWQRQSETGTLAYQRGDAPGPRHLISHDMSDPAQCAPNRIQGFAAAPAAPQFRLLSRGQPRATSSHHETSSSGSCCIDPLNAPAKGLVIRPKALTRRLPIGRLARERNVRQCATDSVRGVHL